MELGKFCFPLHCYKQRLVHTRERVPAIVASVNACVSHSHTQEYSHVHTRAYLLVYKELDEMESERCTREAWNNRDISPTCTCMYTDQARADVVSASPEKK